MSNIVEIKVPDIGDFKDIPIVEILVKPGDSVKPEDPLVSLESDKATMDVPSPQAGTIKEIKAKVGDKVSKGTLILLLDASGAETAAAATAAPAPPPSAEAPEAPTPTPTIPAEARAAPGASAPYAGPAGDIHTEVV